MNQANSTGPVDKVAQVQMNLVYIEGLTRQRRINRDVLKRAVQDTRSLLDALSIQLQQQRLT